MTTANPDFPQDGLSAEAWKPCVLRDLTCDGQWHRGWDGHDPYCQRCPRPKPQGEAYAHELLAEFCACYGEAWPANTCAMEAKRLADWITACAVPPDMVLVPRAALVEAEALLQQRRERLALAKKHFETVGGETKAYLTLRSTLAAIQPGDSHE